MKQLKTKLLTGTFICLISLNTFAHTNHHAEDQHHTGTLTKLEQVENLLQQARATNAEDKYLAAQKLLEKMGKTIKVRIYLAEIQQYFHHFDQALKTLEPVHNNPGSGLLKASIYFTQGKVKRAHQECMQLFGAVDNLVAMTCMAQANSLLGQLDRAYNVLQASLPHMANENEQSQAWAYVTLAEMAERRRDTQAATAYYQKALALNKNDYPSRVALADILLEEKQYPEVLKLTQDYLRNDLVMLRYVRALNIQGDLRTSDHFCELKRRVLSYLGNSEYSKQQQHLHYDLIAEYFMYFSPDMEVALDWAQKHWQQQKTPRDARLLLKVALAASDDAAAEEVLHWLRMYNTEDKAIRKLVEGSILALL